MHSLGFYSFLFFSMFVLDHLDKPFHLIAADMKRSTNPSLAVISCLGSITSSMSLARWAAVADYTSGH